MTLFEKQLWEDIKAFKFDEENTQLTFSRRLVRENRWSIGYTERVIKEYKKFIFLCCTSATPVTPSDAVDQVWHMHLTYTRSYWINFCKNTLKKEIHHNPTKGGDSEKQKFNDYYSALQSIYLEKFKELPPKDIWPDNKMRFEDINFKRINLGNYWLVRKPRLSIQKTATALFTALVAGISIHAEGAQISFIIIVSFIIICIAIHRSNKGNNSDGGCSTTGTCGSCSNDNHSGCASNDSGCGSGCSGCGGCGGD